MEKIVSKRDDFVVNNSVDNNNNVDNSAQTEYF